MYFHTTSQFTILSTYLKIIIINRHRIAGFKLFGYSSFQDLYG